MNKTILFLALFLTTAWNAVAFETDGIEYEAIRNYSGLYELRVIPRLNNSYSGDVIIPATTTSPHTGETIYPVVEIKSQAFERSKELNSVVISDGIKTIGGSAFYGCEALTSVTIPKSVTSIASSAFYGCSSLKTITFPEKITVINEMMFSKSGLTSFTVSANIKTIKRNALGDCQFLTAIDVDAQNKMFISEDGVLFSYDKTTLIQYPAGKTDTEYRIPAGVTSIESNAFDGCENLVSVIMPEGLQTIGFSAFYGCVNLKSVTIPKDVNSIGQNAFTGCEKMTSVTLPEAITILPGGVFSNCTSLSSITMPEVKTIGNSAFARCESLTAFTISEIITSIEANAFDGCTNLETLYFNAKNCSAANFKNCTSLTNLIIGDSVTTIPAGAFSGLKIETLILPESIKNIGNNAFSKSNIKTFVLPKNIQNIGDNAFSECNALTEITIPENITSVGIGAFSNCKGLKLVNFNVIACDKKNTNIFLGCDALEVVNFGNKVTCIPNGAFSDCVSLTDIQFPLSLKIFGSRSFANCYGLTVITIPENVIDLYASPFYNCKNLKTVYYNAIDCPTPTASFSDMHFSNLPITNLIIGNSVKTIPERCFANNKELKTLVIPSGVRLIDAFAFAGCSGLTSISLPDSLEILGGHAFANCTGLTTVTIPEGITHFRGIYSGSGESFANCTNLQTVYYNAKRAVNVNAYALFEGCTSLTTVHFGDSVKIIPAGAFKTCTSVANFNFPPYLEKIGNNAFEGCPLITSITIPEKIVEVGADAFKNCSALKVVNYNADSCLIIGNSNYERGVSVFTNCPLEIINIGENVKSLPMFAFYGCKISEVTIPENITFLGGQSFASCPNLKTVNFNAVKCVANAIGSWNYQYFFDPALTTVNIGENVETIPNGLFRWCDKLTSITIPENIKYIGANAFYGCSSLEAIYYNAVNCVRVGTTDEYPYNVANGYDTEDVYTPFARCHALKNLIIGDKVEHIPPYAFCYLKEHYTQGRISFKNYIVIPPSVKSIGDYAFSNRLDSTITIPSTVQTIGKYAFYRCDSIKLSEMSELIYIGDYAFYNSKINGDIIISSPEITIENYAFGQCKNIKSLVINDNTSGTIGNYAFNDTDSLTYIYIGNRITDIGNYAFYNSSNFSTVPNRIISLGESVANIGQAALTNYYYGKNNITDIVCYGNTPPICNTTTFGTDAAKRALSYGSIKLHVPEIAIEDYAADDIWKNFVNALTFDNTQEEALTIIPDETSAYISWYRGSWWLSNYYVLTVYSDASHSKVVATFRFNSNGELIEKNYLKAGSANFSYIIDDLESETTYYYLLKACNEDDEITDIQNGYFTTSPSSRITTELPELSQTEVSVTAIDRSILVKKAQGNLVGVMDINGRMIVQKTANQSVEQFNVSHAGIYVVSVDGKSYKVLVR
jgi:hypothetical protein